jgi:hypothetical protein
MLTNALSLLLKGVSVIQEKQTIGGRTNGTS